MARHPRVPSDPVLRRQWETAGARSAPDEGADSGNGDPATPGEITVEDAHGTSKATDHLKVDPTFDVEPDGDAALIRYGPTVESPDQGAPFTLDANDGPSQVVELAADATLEGISNLTAPMQLLVITHGHVFGLGDQIRGPLRDFTGDVEVAIAFHRFGSRGIYGLGAGFDPDSVRGPDYEDFLFSDQMGIAATRQAMLDAVSSALAFADRMSVAATRAGILDAVSNAFGFTDRMSAAATRSGILDAISDALAFADRMSAAGTRAAVLDAVSNAFGFADRMSAAATRAAILDVVAGDDCVTLSPPANFRTGSAQWYWIGSGGNVDAVAIPGRFMADGNEAYLYAIIAHANGNFEIQTRSGSDLGSAAGPAFTANTLANGRITVTVPGVTPLVIQPPLAIGDSDEPYTWSPANAAEVAAFYTATDGVGALPTVELCVAESDAESVAFADRISVAATRAGILDAISSALTFADRMRAAATRAGILDAISSALAFTDRMSAAATRAAVLDAVVPAEFADCIPARTGEVVRADITIGSVGTWYSRLTGQTNTGDADGDLVIADPGGTQDLSVDRVQLVSRSDGTYDVRINRDVLNEAYGGNADFNGYFGAGGDGEHKSFFLCRGSTIIEIPASQRRSIGPHYLNLTPNADQEPFLEGLAAADVVGIVVADRTVRHHAFADRMGAAATRSAALDAPPVWQPIPDFAQEALSFPHGFSHGIAAYLSDPGYSLGQLTITTESSNHAVATPGPANTAGNARWVAVGVGSTVITVTATNPMGTTASTSFTLTITLAVSTSAYAFADRISVAATRAGILDAITSALAFADRMRVRATRAAVLDVLGPVWSTIPDMDVEFDAFPVNHQASVGPYVSDSVYNDAQLTISVSSSNTSVATPGNDNTQVRAEMRLIGPGTATITVTATNPAGMSASTSFTLTVTSSVAAPVWSALPHRNIEVTNTPHNYSVSIGQYVSDPVYSDSQLTISTASSNSNVATAGTDNNAAQARFRILSAGSTVITVTATNPAGVSASRSFTVTVTIATGLAGSFQIPIGDTRDETSSIQELQWWNPADGSGNLGSVGAAWAAGSSQIYLASVQIRLQVERFIVRMRSTATGDAYGSQPGPELSDAVLACSSAFRLSAGSAVVVIPGPDSGHADLDASRLDSTDPYRIYLVDGSPTHNALVAFYDHWLTLSSSQKAGCTFDINDTD